MPVFEQPRQLKPEHVMEAYGIKPEKGCRYTVLEKTANPADHMLQRNLYWGEGYENEKDGPLGLVMRTSEEQVRANEARYMRTARERTDRVDAAGLDPSYRETKATLANQRMTVEEFYEGTEAADDEE